MPATSLSLSRKKVPPSPSLCHLLRGVDVDGEFSSVVIFFISNFSQHLFTVKLLIGHAHHPLSVYQGNKSMPPPSTCCLLHGEGSDGEFSSCFCFSPLFKFFSHSSFSSSIAVQQWLLFAVSPILPPPSSQF